MSAEYFEGIYEVDDGYVGKSRPKRFKIPVSEIETGMGREELIRVFEDNMIGDFESHVAPEPMNLEAFITWATQVLVDSE